MQPLQQLLTNVVDYAGLFPPAALPMADVVENYAKYHAGAENWMLGRLVVPLARLAEFESAAGSIGLPPVKISLLTPPLDAADDAFAAAVQQLRAFNERSAHLVDAVEVRVADLAHLRRALDLPESVRCYVEFPVAHADEAAAAIARLDVSDRVFAKIRTGGVTSDLIPDSGTVAAFLSACASAGVGLKATAGLHHPFRAEFPLTYEPGCDCGVMHGFLNVFLGASLLRAERIDEDMLVEFLETAGPGDLQVHADAIRWRDCALTVDDLAAGRGFVHSFGSCSFTEPVEDLRGLNLLPEPPDATD